MKAMLLTALMHNAIATAGSGVSDELLAQGLRDGEIDLRYTHTDEPGGAAQVRILMDLPAERLWGVLLSCEQAFVYIRDLAGCAVLERNADRTLVNHSVKQPWPLPLFDYVFESLYMPYTGIDFHLVKGNLDILEGSWRFSDTPHGLLVEHEIRIKPAFPVPRFLVRHAIGEQLPDLLACLRGLSSGSGNDAREREDLARCPGTPRAH